MEFSEVKKFLDESQSRWKTLKEHVKEDREFLSGSQFSDVDEKLTGRYRIKDCINIISNSCNSIVNNYGKFPFSWLTDITDANNAIDAFLHSNGNENATTQVLYNAVAFGLGVLAISTDYNIFNNQVEPIIYSVQNVENVYLDPCISTINGQDATKAAIVEIKSRQFIKNNYGDEFLESAYTDVSNQFSFDKKIEQPIITYYVKENDVVKVYTFTNGRLVDENMLHSNFIPIIPVFGENTWDDGKMSYQGIVRKAKPVQRLLNYCYMQLCERLSISPKNVYMATRDMVQGVEQYWKDSSRNLNPLLIYNGKDSKGNILNPPVKVDNRVQFDDLTGIMANIMDLMTSITGVNPVGLADDNKTATASVLEHNAYNNNVSHFYDHLKQSFKLAGSVFCQMLALPVNYLECIQGVDEMHANVEARQVLSSLLQVMPDKAQTIITGILSTYPTNMVIQNTLMALNQSAKSPREIELEKALEETTKQLEAAQNQNAAFDKQLALEKLKLDQQYAMHREDNALKSIIEDAKNDTDIKKEYLKESHELNKEREKVMMETVKEAAQEID